VSLRERERGMLMIEVLITIAIAAFGLLGVAALQAKMHLTEAESYERAHATILVRYMSDRINANRKNALAYVTAEPLGTDKGVQDCTAQTGAALDLCEWNNMLAGSAESLAGEQRGAMIGARGCIVNTEPAMPRKFTVAVVWQGLTPTTNQNSTDCASGSYADARMRRAIIAPITVGCLQNDVNTGLCTTP
jgi:type IV pilus assembly protein PilV